MFTHNVQVCENGHVSRATDNGRIIITYPSSFFLPARQVWLDVINYKRYQIPLRFNEQSKLMNGLVFACSQLDDPPYRFCWCFEYVRTTYAFFKQTRKNSRQLVFKLLYEPHDLILGKTFSRNSVLADPSVYFLPILEGNHKIVIHVKCPPVV